jgi:hypothetical protein
MIVIEIRNGEMEVVAIDASVNYTCMTRCLLMNFRLSIIASCRKLSLEFEPLSVAGVLDGPVHS